MEKTLNLLVPIFLYFYWHQKNLISNPKILEKIKTAKDTFNNSIEILSSKNAKDFQKSLKPGLLKIGLYCFFIMAIVAFLYPKLSNSTLVKTVRYLFIFTFFEWCIIDLVFDFKKSTKYYLTQPPVILTAVTPLIIYFLGDKYWPATNTLGFGYSLSIAIIVSIFFLITPYVLLSVLSFAIILFQYILLSLSFLTLRLIKKLNENYLDVFVFTVGLGWIIYLAT